MSESAIDFIKRVYSEATSNEEWGGSLMSDDCTFIRPSGNPIDKKGFAAMMANKDVVIEKQNVSKILEVREYAGGKLVWVSFLNEAKFTYKGTPNDDLAPISVLVEKTSDGWQIRAGHRGGNIKK